MESDREWSPSGSLSSHDAQRTKKRRLHGACDACRKKKGDSAEMPGNHCTNCQLANIQCTHDIPRQPKKSETQAAYIQGLEDKGEKMQRLLQRIYPDQDIDLLLDMSFDDISEKSSPAPTTMSTSSSSQPDLKYPIHQTISKDLGTSKSPPPEAPDDPSEADDLAHIALAEHLSQLSIEAVGDRFFGRSSSFMFVKDVSTVRSEVTGIPNKPDLSKYRRPIFWDIRPWELEFATAPQPNYVYPDEDLLRSLVFIYFDKVNPIYPALHQPTFLRMLLAGQHHWDPSFGMTVLLVCAIASRYSHDPRVMMPGDASGLSSGWKYFCQVPIHRNSLLYRATIYDLQYYALALFYLVGTSIPHMTYNILGLGMRYALEKGAHRRKPNSQKPSAEEELLKRAFCFDVDYPIECDDEYWEIDDPEQAFKQPPGKPCTITSFVCALKLCEILAFALRTLYSTKKSKILSGLIGNEWERRIVAELDSSMNKWKDSLPLFLRWDPEMQNPLFFHQSVSLHATYYYTQIQIHRPFLTKKSSLSFPSLAMCTNAARSCAHILEVSLTRGIHHAPNLIMAAFSAGVVISLNLWGNKRSELTGDPAKEKENLQKIVNFLKAGEKRWHSAGRMRDMLNEVSSLNDYQPTFSKRRRDSFTNLQHPAAYSTSTFVNTPPRPATFPPELPVQQLGQQLNSANYVPAAPLPQQSMANNRYTHHVAGEYIPDPTATEDLFSLWSEVPVAFSSDEWEAYLANVSDSRGLE
ncbi:hypothetical protein BDZ97DRAFT_1779521 [Flammula alnicola]|nr:hypothetical protein BDZ97DRAFT_1779521 [Flammula alnicola]